MEPFLQSALDVYGRQAVHLRDLIGLFAIVCAGVWIVIMIALAFAVLRRRSPGGGPDVQPARERRLGFAVGAALAVTVVIITGLTVTSYLTTRRITDARPDALVLQLKGYQWWWQVTYVDADPSQTLAAANEIHIPVGRPVRVELVGADVIHSFWVPSLAGKQDMIPGRNNEITFTAERPGVYRGQCAQFCGLQHAHMAIFVVAEPPDEFARWRKAQLGPAVAPTEDLAREGEHVFIARNCAACHTIRGTPAASALGPDLTHVASRRTIAAGVLPMTPGALAAWIADPQTIKPGANMPLVPLSALELRAVTAYLAGLQ
jgi:cytochrome c oxidase subunit II